MRHTTDTDTDIDRGDWPDAVTPWGDAAWRRAAEAFTAEGLTAHGLRPAGTRTVRLRPWSVLVRIPTDDGSRVWFKANPPASRFEAGLALVLDRRVPGRVLRPLAADAGRGWSLLPDGGPVLDDVLAGADAREATRIWEEILPRYAQVQQSLTGHAAELTVAGVPGAHTTAMPALLDRLLAGNAPHLDAAERARLEAARPRIAAASEELAALGIADTLDHADLHGGQVLRPEPGRYTFFDWGDSSVTHPFCSLLVTSRIFRRRHGDATLPRLRDAYLEAWTGRGRTSAELRRGLEPALRLAALTRATAWGRLFPGNAEAGAAPGERPAAAQWLLRVLDDTRL
ncbi:phosphotransferase [Streptomyces fragilis]|uniref:Phosphotransferase n=1 Tax=Streptomyces fragilis TaxID=67301 RepID=A0ABV2YPS3_9ACTN|nr:phosphotransferase [Streptomyces fragilis]